MSWLNIFSSSLLYSLAKLISHIPDSLLYRLSDFIAFFLGKIINYRKAVIIQNLSRAFPDLNYKEIDQLLMDFYKNFSDVFIESIMSNSMNNNQANERYKIKNPHLVQEFINQGKNVIALGGHIANWEWVSFISSSYSFNCYTLYKPLSSNISENVILSLRKRFGMKLLPMNKAAKFILKNKNEKSLYIFIGDQSPVKNNKDQKLRFLNQSTTFFNGGARLAQSIDAAVVYLSLSRVKRGYYELEFIPIPYEEHSDVELEIISKYSSLLEINIRKQPANWLWSHKRWKHKLND